MTRDDARKTIDDILACFGNKPEDGTYVLTQLDAKDMREAIKVLEQQPCEDAVNRILKRMWNCRGKNTTSIDKVKMEQIIRDELPSVTPKQKMGHWIHFAWSDDCSECGWSTGKYGSPTKYCPNCGAKMEVSENG